MTRSANIQQWVLAGSLALLAGGAIANTNNVLVPQPRYREVAARAALEFPREHLSRTPFDDAVSSRVWTNYLAGLDFDRVYFLASDIETFRRHELTLDDELNAGDVSFAFEVFKVFKQRVRDRSEFVAQLLEKGFDLSKDESYQWKRKHADWPADTAEWDELWRLRVKNEYVRMQVAKELGLEAGAGEPEEKPETEPEGAPAPLPPTPEESIRKRYEQIKTVMDDYDADWVLQEYLSAFTHAYDPHSDYLSPSALEDFNIEMKLSLVGVGALLRSEDGMAKIVRIIPGGPADHDKRLQPGDKIIAVAQGDGEPVDILHWPLYKVVRLIRGEKGSKVVLSCIPASDASGTVVKKIDLIRDEVKLEEQAASSEVRTWTTEDGRTLTFGVVRLPSFYANMRAVSEDDPSFKSAAYDVAQLFEGMRTQNVDGVVLDLRNNGGGSLLEAVKMTGLFIDSGPTVQVKERFRRRVLYDREPGVIYDGPMVVLVNRLSASASEIVAGALQDYGRAVVVGDSRTHGKGTVQSIAELGTASGPLGSIKVTSAKFYRVSGSSTQLKGVVSDIVVASPFDFMELGEDNLPNALAWSTVERADYAPVEDLNGIITRLREQSEARRRQDPRFSAYARLLARIDEMNKLDSVTLNLEKRKELARAEKEVADMQEKLVEAGEDETSKKPDAPPDLVLEESLAILGDLVGEEQAQAQTAMQGDASRKKTLGETVSDWFRTKP